MHANEVYTNGNGYVAPVRFYTIMNMSCVDPRKPAALQLLAGRIHGSRSH